MDEEKNRVLMAVTNLKGELKAYEVECDRLSLDLTGKKNQALVLSSQLSHMQWKITQADFILGHERERHEKYYQMIDESREKIKNHESQIQIETEEGQEFGDGMIKSLENEKNLLEEKLIHLKKSNEDGKNSIQDSNQVITILKKRNAALMLKLRKRLEEAENEEKSLTSRLEITKTFKIAG